MSSKGSLLSELCKTLKDMRFRVLSSFYEKWWCLINFFSFFVRLGYPTITFATDEYDHFTQVLR